MYKHITEGERWQIFGYLRDQKKPIQIAKLLDRDKGSISREISRNSKDGVYMPKYTQREADIRRTIANYGRRKIGDNEFEKEIEFHLQEKNDHQMHYLDGRKRNE